MPTTRIAMAATTLAMLTSSVQVSTPMPAIVSGMPMLRMPPGIGRIQSPYVVFDAMIIRISLAKRMRQNVLPLRVDERSAPSGAPSRANPPASPFVPCGLLPPDGSGGRAIGCRWNRASRAIAVRSLRFAAVALAVRSLWLVAGVLWFAARGIAVQRLGVLAAAVRPLRLAAVSAEPGKQSGQTSAGTGSGTVR